VFIASAKLRIKFQSLILRLGSDRHLPVAGSRREWVEQGALFSYAENIREVGRVAASRNAQWKTLRTTNTIERLHEEFRRRVKTQGSLPSEDAALVLLFSLVASGQIKLRRIDGWRKIAAVPSQHPAVAA
jgi:Transposase, Mutator family